MGIDHGRTMGVAAVAAGEAVYAARTISTLGTISARRFFWRQRQKWLCEVVYTVRTNAQRITSWQRSGEMTKVASVKEDATPEQHREVDGTTSKEM
jgi:hypothetical protein